MQGGIIKHPKIGGEDQDAKQSKPRMIGKGKANLTLCDDQEQEHQNAGASKPPRQGYLGRHHTHLQGKRIPTGAPRKDDRCIETKVIARKTEARRIGGRRVWMVRHAFKDHATN